MVNSNKAVVKLTEGWVMRSNLPQLILNREKRLGRRIRQKEIAEACEISEATISRWMKQEPLTAIDSNIARRLMGYFDCSLDDLIYIDKGSVN